MLQSSSPDLHSGPEEGQRVDRVAVAPHLVVQMRAGRAAAAADLADDAARRDMLADLHVDPAQMCVARRKSVAMVDLDHPAIAAVPTRLRHGARRGRVGVGTERCAKVDARMQRRRAEQRILADAVAARDRPSRRRVVDRKRARFLLQRVQLVERVVQFLDLGVEHGRARRWRSAVRRPPACHSRCRPEARRPPARRRSCRRCRRRWRQAT